MILRVCVVIPTFNNPTTISDVLKDVVKNTSFPILVVDDGSHTPVTDKLYSWDVRQAMESGRLRIVRFEKNRGKGAAMQFAIGDLAAQGFTHMLTMDGDGQHVAGEIQKLVALAKEHPWDLIVGHRRLKSDNVPGISKFGRKFSNFWVGYQTGQAVRDSQSGFRLYPLFSIQNYSFFTKRYDFEIEVLIRLLWNGVNVREVEIDVYYPPSNERVSHFHKLWDNVRISILNTVLVAISLMKSHTSPLKLAVSAAMGTFIGTTPFFGLHTLMVAGAAFVLRLNVVAMFIGSNISFPPLAPFLLLGSVYIGSQWLEVGLNEGPLPHFQQWLLGSLVLGAGLALVVGLLTFIFSWLAQRSKRHTSNWSGRSRGGRFGNWFLRAVLRYGGLRAGYFCLLFVIPYFYWFAPKSRRGLNEYYRILEPKLNLVQRFVRVHRHLYRFGQILMDRALQNHRKDFLFTAQSTGLENIGNEVAKGNGLILLGGHLGGWDLASGLLRAQGFKSEVFRIEYRAELGENQNTIFEIHQALKLGRSVGLMGDRPLSDRFELIPFLGKLAPFDVTAFKLAAATKVPLIITFGFKGAGRNYEFYARPARTYQFAPELSRDLQLYAWTEQFVGEVEQFVRKYPDQWFNFYPFWSSIPTAPDGRPGRTTGNCLLEELPIPANLESAWAPDQKPISGPESARS